MQDSHHQIVLLIKRYVLAFFALFSAFSTAIADGVAEAGLTVLSIITVNAEEPTCDYVFAPEGAFGISITNQNTVAASATLTNNGKTIYDSSPYSAKNSGLTIKIRGNTSTYYSSKKPYKIKLETKGDMLGRSEDKLADKNWILIDSGGDDLNTMIGLKMNEIMGLGGWTPAYMFVNLFMNGDYRGVYMLLESIRRNPDCRLNVDKRTGYIIECDAYWWNEDKYFATDSDRKYTFKYPDEEDVTNQQIDYIRQTMNTVEQTIADGTYPDFIDVNSFATWLLAHDILGTYDSGGANIYLTKFDNTNTSKITLSTLWDFGSIMKSEDCWARIHTDSFFYFDQLIHNSNNTFISTYLELWNKKSNQLFDKIIQFLNDFSVSSTAMALAKSRPYDAQRWGYEASTVEENIQQALAWFTYRKQWMSQHVETNNIINYQLSVTASLKTYNLKGQIVNNANNAGIYIQNGKKFIQRLR